MLVPIVAISNFPSPSISPVAISKGALAVVKLPADENELVAMEPGVEIVFLNTFTFVVFEAFAISGKPSLSKSATEIMSPISYQLPAPADAVILIGLTNEFAFTVKLAIVEFVTSNGNLLWAIRPVEVLVILINS